MNKLIIGVLGLVLAGVVIAAAAIVFLGPERVANVDTREFVDTVSETREGLARHYVQDATSRSAVCNDGSPAVYFHRPAEEGFEGKWVVWLEGGGGCKDAEECALRQKEQRYLMTSNTTGEYAKKGGILSIDEKDNPDFYGWNHVMLNYCSSDSWIGDGSYSGPEGTWEFRGKDIVRAVFEDLKNPDLFDDPIGEASQVLITGSSAGGGGAAQNLNDIVSGLPGVDVRGVIDSSLGQGGDFPTTAFTEEEITEIRSETKDIAASSITFQNRQPDAACVAANGGDKSACTSVNAVMPHWTVPVFNYISQTDRKKLSSFFEAFEITDRNQKDQFIEDWAAGMQTTVADMDAVFSPKDPQHVAISNDGFTKILIDGLSFADVLGNWYFDREGPTALIE